MDTSFPTEILSTLLSLFLVGVLAWVSLSLLKRLQERRSGAAAGKPVDQSKLLFVRALPVGAKERIVVVMYRGEEWLLGVAPGRVSLLGRVASPPVEAQAPALVASPSALNPSPSNTELDSAP